MARSVFSRQVFRYRNTTLIALCLSVIVLTGTSRAQLLNAVSPPQAVYAGNESFLAVQKRFQDYVRSENIVQGKVLRNGIREKVANYNIFKRWEYYWEQRVNQQTGVFPNTDAITEYNRYLSKLKKSTSYSESWTNLGTNTSEGGYAGLGRINCIAFHPTDENTFWAGSPSGGLWKTTNGGSSWTILNDNLTVLGVSDIIIPSDYAATNTMYILTGDRDGGSMWSLNGGQGADNPTIGVMKSTNGGTTWTTTGCTYSTAQGLRPFRLLMDPSNSSTLLASFTDGIFRTVNGGTNWTKTSTVAGRYVDMEFKPGDPNIVYAATMGVYVNPNYVQSVYRSTDNGQTWNSVASVTGAYRCELAVSPADPAVVYMLCCNSNGGLVGIYKSTDSGQSFPAVYTYTTVNMLGYYTNGSGSNSGQGRYDLCMAVNPADANTVYIGGINTWKSTNGGSSWSPNSCWTSYSGYNSHGVPEVHADKHSLVFRDANTLFEGNDGGIYKTVNGGTSWTDLTNGMVISQIYRIGIAKTDQNKILAGLQDNGSKKYVGAANTWVDVTGGDGMECIIDHSNTNYMYATYVNGEIYRNTNGFTTGATTTISANIPGGQPAGAWVTPYIMDPSNSATLYAGYDRVWKTTDRGNSWTAVSQQLSDADKLRSLAIAPSNANYIYAADRTHMWRTTDGGATNWTAITLPTTSYSITYIAVKNNDPNTVWISYGGFSVGDKVYKSTDGGSSWTALWQGLPNIPVMCVVQYTANTAAEVLFAGTDAGVYVKSGTNNWEAYNSGLPNVVVTELEVYYDQVSGVNKLRAGTYGRGLWETTISSALPVQLTAFDAETKDWNVNIKWSTATEVNSSHFVLERSADNQNWSSIAQIMSSGNSNSPKNYSYVDKKLTVGKYYYRLKSVDTDGSFEYSRVINAEVLVPSEFRISQNYPNPFNPETRVKFELPRQQKVKLAVYNQLGEEVAVLIDRICSAGVFESSWNAAGMPSGIYYMKILIGSESLTRKLLLLK